MKKRWLAPALLTLTVTVFTALLWHFTTSYAYRPHWVDLGPVPEARNNPFYAAQLFLEKKGIKVKTAGLLPEVMDRLETTDTLFLFYDHEIEYEILSERINQWVKQGGHLVVTVHYLWDEANQSSGDSFLDALGVRQHLWHGEEPADSGALPEDALDDSSSAQNSEESTDEELSAEEELEQANNEAAAAEAELADADNAYYNLAEDDGSFIRNEEIVTLLPLSHGNHPLQIAFEPEYHIEDVSGKAHAPFTAPPAHLLQYSVGAGKITVLTDYFIFNDSNIGDYDHAFFLWWLAQESPRVWLVYDKGSDALFSLIWQSAPYLCLSVLLTLCAWLLYKGRRFGPVRQQQHAQRRQLQEHIDAASHLLWREQEQYKLIDEARQHVVSRIAMHGGRIVLTPRQARIVEQAGISPERLQWALTTQSADDEEQFVDLIRLLQQLRMSL